MTAILAASVLCVSAAAPAGEPKADIGYWMSKDVQALPPGERIKLLDKLVAAAGRQFDVRFLRDAFIQDPAAEVKLKILDTYVARFANNWRVISRLNEWFPDDLLADYELTCAAADIVVVHTGKYHPMRRRTATFLVMVLDNMPYPDLPPAGAKVKVTYNNGVDRRKRPRTRQIELDAAGARRARELFAKVLAQFSGIAGRQFRPSPTAQQEVRTWWDESRQGRVFMAQDEWERIKASGYSTIKSADPARVIASTYLGTRGTEWLAGGGFQPDGTIVVAGTSLGPMLQFAGAATKVLGPDGKAPPAPQAEVHPADRDVQFCWMHSQGTPFVVRLAPDARSILSATRLPWCSGAVTSAAVDASGGIYVAGPARKALRPVCADAKDLAPARALPQPEPRRGQRLEPPNPHAWEHAYVAKLSPAADRVLWVRFVDNPNKCANVPEVLIDARGRVQFTSCDLRVLDPRGGELERHDPASLKSLPGRFIRFQAEKGWQVTAHEHHWPTGHEPWRCPYVAIRSADGSRFLTLYDWPGPFVGAATRNVADSFFYGFRFDSAGDLTLLGRCDGGNTVLLREPLDVMRWAEKLKGLGYSAAGVGATCLTFIIRVSTRTWTVTGGSIFPPGTVVEDAIDAPGGGVLAVCSGGLKLTDNHICTGLPWAPFILVTDAECRVHRFSSAMPGCGQARVGHVNWAIASGTVAGRPRALFLTAAAQKAKVFDYTFDVPSANALQKDFAGGALDGHLTAIDLDRQTAPRAGDER